jgi:alanyl-tRNA synthetase
MRTLRTAVLILLVLHLVGAIGFVGWLGATDRLNRQRVVRTAEVFKLTVAEEQRQGEQAKKLEAQTRAQAQEAARLESIGSAKPAAADRLADEGQRNDVALQRLERMQREKEDLVRQLQAAKDLIARQQADLTAAREAFEQAKAAEVKQRQDRDFQQAVEMYEQLPAKQAKGMLQDLLKAKKGKEVVDYLAAMQLRKAATVLKEFKTPEEIAQATELVERLRERGVDLLTQTRPSATQPGGAT